MAPKMLRLSFVPGVITSCRSPLTIQAEPDHDQAQSDAPGALEQGHDLELVIGGGLGEDVGGTQELTWPRWVSWKAPTRLLFAATPTPDPSTLAGPPARPLRTQLLPTCLADPQSDDRVSVGRSFLP